MTTVKDTSASIADMEKLSAAILEACAVYRGMGFGPHRSMGDLTAEGVKVLKTGEKRLMDLTRDFIACWKCGEMGKIRKSGNRSSPF